jgi:hypothetical protein
MKTPDPIIDPATNVVASNKRRRQSNAGAGWFMGLRRRRALEPIGGKKASEGIGDYGLGIRD